MCFATFLLLACSLFTITDPATAATVSAASCEQAAVNAAIAQASTGDIVQVPSGTCTWGSSRSFVSVNKAITLRGAGRGATVIEIASTAGSWTNATIRISAAAEVRGFTIKTVTSGSSGTAFSASANGFRISDIVYLNQASTTNGYFVYAGAYGLVDNCDITGGSGSNELIFARGPTNSWQTDHSIGQADNLFIENNEFDGRGYVCDCNSNSRCVVRYNSIAGPMKVDGHGKASNSPPRGVRHMEVYNNLWTTNSTFWSAIEIRGGGGRIFNNVATNSSSARLYLTDYAATNVWSNFGDVCQCPANYPIDDQIGVGKDPKTAAAEPLYLWNNSMSGAEWPLTPKSTAACTATCGTFAITDIVQPGRDYFTSASKPEALAGYQPFTCPHPLAGSGTCGPAAGREGYSLVAPPPTPPTNLRVVP
jgi:hypothetical protein